MKYNAVVASVPYDALHMSCSGFLTCIPCTNEVDCDAFCSSAYLCLKHNTTTHHMVSALQLTVFWNCILDPCYWQCNRGTVFMDQLYCQCGTVFLAVFSWSCILGSVFWELYSWIWRMVGEEEEVQLWCSSFLSFLHHSLTFGPSIEGWWSRLLPHSSVSTRTETQSFHL